jgi:hypothetical protein
VTNEELLIILKEKTEAIKKLSNWSNMAWELLKNTSPENITYKEPEAEQKVHNKFDHKWDELLNDEEKEYPPLILSGYWNNDNYIIKPVRHYADHHNRDLIVRNMRSAKMLSSVICPYFYPKYKSSLNTRVYIDTTRNKKMWLRDNNDKWHSVSYTNGIKNMIFHAVSVYADIIRREGEILDSESVITWKGEQKTLENYQSENYKIICKNLVKRIPTLDVHPEEEEKRLAETYLKDDEFRIDLLTEITESNPEYYLGKEQDHILIKKAVQNIRDENSLKYAKNFHALKKTKIDAFKKKYLL